MKRRSNEDPRFKSSPAKSQSSEHSHPASISESKIYQTEDEFVNSLLDEIKEESSNITSEDTSQIRNSKIEMVNQTKTSLKKPARKILKKAKQEVDPLDLLSEDFEIVDQTMDQGSSAVGESNNFQDTIIGSQYLLKFSSKCSKNSTKSVKNKPKSTKNADRMQINSNKVPSLNLYNKYSNIKYQESENADNNMIDMLLSEEGDVIEESIIQLTENSIAKHPPVKMKKSNLVKVDPVERYQEVMRNEQRGDTGQDRSNKKKPRVIDYAVKMQNDEESVKLEDLVQNSNKRIKRSQKTEKNNKSRGNKNIFFDVCSAQNDEDDDPVLNSLLDSDINEDESLQSHREEVPHKNMKRPIFFGFKPKSFNEDGIQDDGV